MDISSTGLWNGLGIQDYFNGIGSMNSYTGLGNSLSFANVYANIIRGLYAGNTGSYSTLNPDDTGVQAILQRELGKLGYGNVVVILPEDLEDGAELSDENVAEYAQKIANNLKKWQENYDTVRRSQTDSQIQSNNKSQAIQAAAGTGRVLPGSSSHHCSLRSCSFDTRS